MRSIAAGVMSNDPDVVQALARQIFELKGVVTTLRDQVQARMVKLFASDAGATIGDLQQVIAELLPPLREEVKDVFKARASRALTVARTETAHASNTARFVSMQKAGVRRHQWLTSNDPQVRDSHAAIDGQIVEVGAPFANGLRHPSEPGGPAAEVINCRCLTRPIIET